MTEQQRMCASVVGEWLELASQLQGRATEQQKSNGAYNAYGHRFRSAVITADKAANSVLTGLADAESPHLKLAQDKLKILVAETVPQEALADEAELLLKHAKTHRKLAEMAE